MAKGIRLGVGGNVRVSKKCWVGVGGVARRVKKIFAGIDGAVKIVFSAGVSKLSGIPRLSASRESMAITANASCIMFSGGDGPEITSYTTYLDIYDNSMVHTSNQNGHGDHNSLGIASEKYGFIFGGYYRPNEGWAYDTSSVKTSLTRMMDNRRDDWYYGTMSGTTIGGTTIVNSGGRHSFDMYNNVSLEKVRSIIMGSDMYSSAATSNNTYAIFAGGRSATTITSSNRIYDSVNAFDSSGVWTTSASMSIKRTDLGGASVGEYALFAGGCTSEGGSSFPVKDLVECYDNNLVKSVVTPLSIPRENLLGMSLGDYALFIGGYGGTDTYRIIDTVDIYDRSLVRTIGDPVENPGSRLRGISFRGRGLFISARTDHYSSATDIVEGYEA